MSRIIQNPKQLILNKSKEILYNNGYSKLNMRDIAKGCDISIGTIYNYYPTKKDLILEMMIDYWEKCFNKIDKIISSNYTFYTKLNKIFSELSAFIKTFKEVWLKPELYRNSKCIESGVEKEHIFLNRLILKIQDMLIHESSKPTSKINLKLDPYETSKFIILNFITIVQMPFFQYESFEKILKELFEY